MEQQQRQVGVVLIGVGRAGSIHANNLVKMPEVKLLYLVDIDIPRCEEMRAQYFLNDTQITTPDKLDDILPDNRIDAVVICTPTLSHEPHVKTALSHGKAVFCEKPIAETEEGTRACYEAARKANRPLFCSFNRRFDPSNQSVRDRVKDGELGGIHVVKVCSRDCPLPPVEFLKNSGGLFHDCAVHDIDMMCWILGEFPQTVFAEAHSHHKEIAAIGDYDTIAIILKFPSGIIGNIEVSRHSTYGYDTRVEVHGWKGMLISDNQRETSVTGYDEKGPHGGELKFSFPQRYKESYAAAMTRFLRAAQGKEECAILEKEIVNVSKIASACEESARTGKRVTLALDGPAKLPRL